MGCRATFRTRIAGKDARRGTARCSALDAADARSPEGLDESGAEFEGAPGTRIRAPHGDFDLTRQPALSDVLRRIGTLLPIANRAGWGQSGAFGREISSGKVLRARARRASVVAVARGRVARLASVSAESVGMTMEPTLITVSILTYKRRETLVQALDSVRAQSYMPHEVVVVDNGSEDDLESFLKDNYPEVRLVALKENLAGAGRNRGVEA